MNETSRLEASESLVIERPRIPTRLGLGVVSLPPLVAVLAESYGLLQLDELLAWMESYSEETAQALGWPGGADDVLYAVATLRRELDCPLDLGSSELHAREGSRAPPDVSIEAGQTTARELGERIAKRTRKLDGGV